MNDQINQTKEKIVDYLLNHPATSKAILSKELNLSMPTILNNVNQLLAKGVLIELGEYESTGGRKAKSIGINKSYAHSLGIIITAHHVKLIIVNLNSEVILKKELSLAFSEDVSYCAALSKEADLFKKEAGIESILGIGISIPGIIDHDQHMLTRSHALGVENYSLRFLEQMFHYPVYIENDANAAMLAEKLPLDKNALYLSLSHTLGGAFCINGKLFRGESNKAGEFGHMTLVPGGTKCYCGKAGCADAYCASSVLTNSYQLSLDDFMKQVNEGDPFARAKWENYLEYLAILITNLRMAYDMDIILGGDIGGFLNDHMLSLSKKIMAYNGFDYDTSYLKLCSYKKDASGIGVAKHFFTSIV